jgi:cellulose synthase/poly-beta-1,6-N-acetylglucosamine synthase-like glycosyltransferase
VRRKSAPLACKTSARSGKCFGWLEGLELMLAILLVNLVIIIYVYLGYPSLLRFARTTRSRRTTPREGGDARPVVSLVIPAYNEWPVIRQKLENSLAVAYPADRLEIIVASDGSDDGTNEIVEEFASRRIVLRAFAPRAGKISVLNRTIPDARGEVVALCDANVMFHADALERLVDHFADPDVGAVTGDVRIASADAPFGDGEGLYYKYERFIQSQESALGSTVTVDGGMYAIRKQLFRPLPVDTILDDFVIGMNVALAGYRVIYDPAAVATENATMDVRQEFRRKVRIVAGGFRELLRGHGIPGPWRPQLFWSYVSHKLLRWLVPWCLLAILASSAILAWRQGPHSVAAALVFAQLAFYACALIGTTRPNAHWPAMIGVPFYFCMVNAAAGLGLLRGLSGAERVMWKKAQR